ncbi:cupin [Halomonas jincaotanensis]|uniref:cupin n=1 Tax=Halomonas jincaotanensis TaxID=2810616 RepID=UPI002022E322|nr:cupin [Halomonas jincaotanensis]
MRHKPTPPFTASPTLQTGGTEQVPAPQTLRFEARGGFPNSPLPVLIYRQLFGGSGDELATAFETLFERHRWPPQWRYGLFDFDHFHSTAHEALGVFSGKAHIRLGGPQGDELDVAAGDVLILPAGTGHACLQASDDFAMVGAYPPGQVWEVERGDPAELAAAQARVARVELPADDPVGGELLTLWR